MADNTGWWAKKLGQQAPPPQPGIPVVNTPPAPPPVPYQQQPHSTPQMPVYQPPAPQMGVPVEHAPNGVVMQQDGHVNVAATLAQQATAIPDLAIASKMEQGRCPSCGSGNWYTGVANGAPVKPHCFDCGYPHVQAGSGGGSLGSASGSGPARPAKQVAPSGFHPQQVIGRVG